jgi:hypothetical protein
MNNCLYNILIIILLLAVFSKTNVPKTKVKPVITKNNYTYVPFLKTYVTNVNNNQKDHCDQRPNSESKCKVDFSFQHCNKPKYNDNIKWCAENCKSFKHALNCGPFPRPGCEKPRDEKNKIGYPVTKEDIAKFIAENQTICKNIRENQ